MPALLKFLVPLAIFLSGSYAHAFTSLSPVAGNQARVNHLIRFEESISEPTNEPTWIQAKVDHGCVCHKNAARVNHHLVLVVIARFTKW